MSQRLQKLNSLKCGVLVSVVGLLSACSQTSNSYTPIATYAAAPPSFTICSGYGCKIKNKSGFSAQQMESLKEILATGADNPKAERIAIAKAIGMMETMSRKRLRYAPDVEFTYQRNDGKRGQMDCVDESLNTTAYLKVLYKAGYLKYHKPIKRFATRGFLLDGRYPHKSARMMDQQKNQWAVDSWKKPDGGEPEIMPLGKWYKGRSNTAWYQE